MDFVFCSMVQWQGPQKKLHYTKTTSGQNIQIKVFIFWKLFMIFSFSNCIINKT